MLVIVLLKYHVSTLLHKLLVPVPPCRSCPCPKQHFFGSGVKQEKSIWLMFFKWTTKKNACIKEYAKVYSNCIRATIVVQYSNFRIREICLWDTSRSWFGLENTIRHVFVYGTRKFVTWSMRHRTVSSRQKKLEINLSSRHHTVSHRQKHEITVSHRQKHAEQCLLDQATNEECSTDKFPLE
jgi:hypothetical protein